MKKQTAAEFKEWMVLMKHRKIAKNCIECAKLLGVTNDTITNMRKRGGNTRDRLACKALLEGLE